MSNAGIVTEAPAARARRSTVLQDAVRGVVSGLRSRIRRTPRRSIDLPQSTYDRLEPRVMFATQLSFNPADPAGGRVYRAAETDAVSVASETDEFEVTVAAGQRLSARVTPTPGSDLRPRVTILSDDGSIVYTTADASAAGESAIAQPVALPSAGTYRIDVSEAGGTTGGYRIEAFLNSYLEDESTDNDTLVGAVNLNGQTTLLQGSGRLAAAAGTGDGSGKRDLYRIDLAAGEAFSALLDRDGDGFGQFAFEDTFNLVSGYNYAVGTGDFNNDGFADVVVGGESGSNDSLRVLLSDGNGGLTSVDWGSPGTIYDLVVGDFNEDGNLDVATVSLSSSYLYEGTGESTRLTLYFGAGDGSAQNSYDRFLGGSGYTIATGDLDNDDRADLVVGIVNYVDEFTPDLGTVALFLGDGFGNFDSGKYYAALGKVYDVAIVDLDNDGYDDILAAQGDLDDENGWITQYRMSSFDPGFVGSVSSDTYDDPIIRVAAGDFNGTGGGDYVGLHYNSRNVSVTLNDTDGNPFTGYGFELQPSSYGSQAGIVLSDVNRDGRLDLLTTSGGYGPQEDSIHVALNDGSGFFFAGFSSLDKMGRYVGPFGAADLNGDGDVDLVGISASVEYDEGLQENVVEVSTRLGLGEVNFELLDAAGDKILLPGSGGFNAYRGILDYVSPSGGPVYLSVTGDVGQRYQVALTGGAKFGLDPELIDDRPQDITLAGQIASRVQHGGEVDVYTVGLVSGDVININVVARNPGPGAPGGDLIPRVELIDPNGNVVASDLNPTNATNAAFNYNVTATGTYKVRITSKTGSGDYDVTVTGQTGATTPFTVQSTNPTNGSTIGYRPWVGIKFTQPVLISSVQAADLLVNGQPAVGISPSSGYEIFFNTGDLFPTDGTYTVTIPAGSIISAFGQVLGEQTFSFTVDAVGPQVTSSTLQQDQTIAPGSLAWNATFDEELVDFLSDGIFAQLILDPSDVQTTNLSSGAAYALSQMMHVQNGPRGGPTELGFAYNNLLEGRYEVRFKSGGSSFFGYGPGTGFDFQALDGEFNGTFPSGDGNSGGDFVLNFNVDAPGITQLTSLTAMPPVGSIVHELSTVRALHQTGDVDSYSISLDSNQQITVMLVPQGGGATAKLDLRDPSGTLLSTATGAAGETVILQSVNGTTGGLYQIDATSLAGFAGYTLRVIINAAAESELTGTLNNNSRATAQSLNTRQLTPGFPGVRSAIVGDATGSEDFYRIDLVAGQPASFALSGVEGAEVSFRLENSAGTIITYGAGGQGNADQTAIDFIPNAGGAYYVVVTGTGRYNLLATRDASFERELSPAPDPAQDLSVTGQMVGHLRGGTPGSGAIDVLQVGPNFASFGGNLDHLINQLNDDTHYNFNATRTTVAGADTFEELAPYDVVILTQLSSSQYTPGLASALKKYVELGGAVIVSGSVTTTFTGATISPFAQLLPFTPTSGVSFASGALSPAIAHPITNLYAATSFPVSTYYPLGVVSGATVVGVNGANPTLIVRENIGFGGRTIFLGPEYADQFNSTTLRTGDPDRLLEQAIAYAAQSGDRSDAYSLSLVAGDSIVLTTSTPNSETALPVNLLDPIVELYSPAGVLVASNDNGPDGINSRINYTAPATGTYRVVVRAKDTDGGAYTLQVTGASGSSLVVGPKVVSTTPATTPLSAAPGTIDIVLSENILLASVQPSDLVVVGGSVTGAQLIDGRTVRFSVSVPNVDATYNYSIAAGAFTDLQGDTSDAFASSFTIDKIGPRVVSSNPASQASSPFTTWSFTFSEDLSPLPTSYNYSSLFDITRPDGSPLPSFNVSNVVINGNTFTINLSPQTAAGNYTVVLKPALFKDLRGNVMDQDQDGTGGEATDDRFTSTISIASPNLVVDSVEVLNTPVFGSPVTVRWTVRNAGTDPAADGWQDRLYLSLDDTIDGNDLILLTIGTPTTPLAPGQTYTREQTINLPLNVSVTPGSYRFIVRTDRSNTQQESNENDNTNLSPVTTVSLPALPDLAVSNVQVTPPTPSSGGQATVQWTLTNSGTAPVTGVIRDRILLSTDATAGSDTSIGEFDYAVNLAPGASVTRTALVTIPINQFGQRWFVVSTDVNNVVFEHTNEPNNTALTSAPVNVTLAPVPDLQITAITAPANVTSGTSPTISWTLANNGTADFTGTISENLFLSPDGSIGGDEFVKTVSFTGTIAAGASITRTTTLDIPISYAGTRYVVITTDAANQVFEDVGENNNTTIDDEPMTIVLPPTPDLVVSSITAPLSAQSGKSFTVQWQITNNGTAATSGSFSETIYLSSDSAIGNDQSFGNFSFTGSIAAGQTITRSQTIQLPNVYEGTFRVVVATDSGNAIFENTGEGNNVSIDDTDLIISQSPFPNLIVSGITAPPTASSEESIEIDWVVTNTGGASTSALGWSDRVYISQNATFDGTDTLLATVPNASFLNAGDSYAQTATVTLPQGLQGDYYFFVVTDASNQVFEYAPLASAETDNQNVSSPITITLAPPPDLVVTAVAAPLVAFSGELATVSWTVTNNGVGATRPGQTSWFDDIWLSTDTTIDGGDEYLGFFAHTGALASGASYSNSASVRLPAGISGDYYFIVRTDSNNRVYEDAFEANNATADTTTTEVLLAPPADLRVNSLSIPPAGTVGRGIQVDYSVINEGASATNASGWVDRIYLSPTPTLESATAILISSRGQSGTMVPGASYSNSVNAVVPLGTAPGNYYVFVAADSQNQVLELDNANNIVGSVGQVTITEAFADLQTSNFVYPAIAEAGTGAAFSFTVTNAGTGNTIVNQWTDRIILSSDNVLGNGDDLILLNELRQGVLEAGGSYTVAKPVAIPQTVVAGEYNLFLFTDVSNQVTETDNVNNNNALSPVAITITRQTPDLQVTAVTAPPAAASRSSINVSLTVENLGTAATQATSWIDEIWLSLDDTIGSDDVRLAQIQRSGSLAINGSYTVNRTVTLPDVVGDYRIVVRTDRSNQVVEGPLETNNDRASGVLAIAESIEPDLAVSNVVAPAATFSGQRATVSYDVTNTGADLGAGVYWYDTIYLSQDATLDSGDRAVGTFFRGGGVAPSGNYAATESVDVPPGLSGEYFLIVRSDSSNRVFERDRESNNISTSNPTTLSLLPPVDLVAGTIVLPVNGTPGQNASITYTVTNNSSQPALGRWTDSLYLSSDPVWDINDRLFARYEKTGPVEANESYSPTVNAPLPGVTPGEYYLIVRSDILNQIAESDENNNLAASLDSFALDVPALALDVPTNGSIAQNQGVYYRVTVPAGETLLIDFDAAATNGSTQLFVKYGDVPTRSTFDFGYTEALAADQKIIVPVTEAGTYYILAYGDSLSAPTNYSIEARILQFDVIDTNYGIGGNGGSLTLQINGAKFDRTITPTLVSPGGGERAASRVFFNSANRLYATFDLTGLTPNAYDVKLTKTSGESVVVADGLTVVAARPAQARPVIFGPGVTGSNALFQFTVSWGNDGINDVPAPYLVVTADRPIGTNPDFINNAAYTFIGTVQDDGPAGIIRAGKTSQREFYARNGPRGTAISLFADRLDQQRRDDAFDWESLRDLMDTGEYTTSEFGVAFARMVQNIGPTWGDFTDALGEGASLVPETLSNPRLAPGALQFHLLRAAAETSTSISGRIHAPDMRVPIAGRSVLATNSATGEIFEAITMNDGSYFFTHLSAGDYQISYDAGAVISGGVVSVAGGQHIADHVVGIEAEALVGGTIRRASDNAIVSGAVVVLIDELTGTTQQTTSDETGRYLFESVSSGAYTLYAEASGLARTKLTSLVLSGTEVQSRNFTLIAEAKIVATVQSPVGPNTPMEVLLRQPPSPTAPADTFRGTTVGGNFEVTHLPAGTYLLTIARSGYVTYESMVTVSASQTLNLGTITLARAAVVQGTIVSTYSQLPASGAGVGLYAGQSIVASALANENGAFEFDDVPVGTYVLRAGIPDGIGFSSESTVVVTAGGVIDAGTVQILPGGIISGTLRTPGGATLPGTRVTLALEDGTVRTGITNVHGNYMFENLPLGSHRVVAGEAGATGTVGSLDGTAVDVDLTVPVVATVRGHLRDATSSPVFGTVTLEQDGRVVGIAETSSEGEYTFRLFAAGVYSVAATSSNAAFDAQTGVVINPGDELTLDFTAGVATLGLTVADAASSVAGAQVILNRLLPGGTAVEAGYAVAGASGVINFGQLLAGEYELKIVSADGLRGATRTVSLSAGTNAIGAVSIGLQGRVRGTVQLPGSLPAVGAKVALLRMGAGVASGIPTLTDANGDFALENLAAGTYTLVVMSDGYQTSHQTLVISDNSTATPSVALVEGDTLLTGRAVDAQGNPIADGDVAVTDSTGQVLHGIARLNADGTFSFRGITAAGLRVSVASGFGGETVVENINLLSGTSVALGDVSVASISTAALIDSTAGSAAGFGGNAGLGFNAASLFAAMDASLDPDPAWVRELIEQAERITRSPGEITRAQVPPVDKCQECINNWTRVQNEITFTQNKWQAVQAYLQQFQRAKSEAVSFFFLDLTRTGGVVSKYFFAFRSLLASGAYGAWNEATKQLEVGKAAIAGAVAGIAGSINELRRIVTQLPQAPSLDATLNQIQDVASIVARTAGLLTSVINLLGASAVQSTRAALGKMSMGFTIVGLLSDLRRDLPIVTFADYRNSANEVKQSIANFTDAYFGSRGYLAQVKRAREALDRYIKCLAHASLECDGTNDNPYRDPDYVRLVPVFVSSDPNDILGPAGFGPAKFVPASVPLDYTIRFENEPAADAPAQVVTITQTLDSDLDARTFRLGDFGFSGEFFDVPADSSFYQTRLDLRETRGIYLDVVAGIDLINNEAFWRFISIDPATGDVPANPLLGFLPVNTTSPEGEGFVQYTIRAKSGAQTGDVIDAAASIIFDQNAPIDTPAIFNTLDVFGPSSAVDALPAVSAQDFVVFWNGDDDQSGSAIATFDVYVSTDGGEYVLWLDNTDLRQATFVGENGKSYAFYSVAVDNVGNIEGAPSTPDATTTVGGVVNTPPALDLDESAGASAEGSAFSRSGIATDPDANDVLTAEVDYGTGGGFVPLTLDANGNFTLANTFADNGVYTVVVRVTDSALATVTKQIEVTVSNVDPTVATIENQVITWDGTGGTFTVGGSFFDPGADTFSGEVNYGSGFVPLVLNPDGTFSLSNRYTAPGLYTVTVRVADDDAGIGERTFDVRLLPPPPSVASIQVNDGNAQRSMVKSLQVTFDHAVATFPAGAISIRLRTPTGPVAIAATMLVTQTDTEGKVWTITFTGPGLEGGSLADGFYDITIDQSKLSDSFAQAGTGTSQAGFHRLFGDFDGDRDADAVDNIKYRPHLLGQTQYLWYFDSDSDGDIDNTDYTAARLRLRTRLFV